MMRIELLKAQHPSIPRNRTLADLFFKAGYIEVWGRGMSVIYRECEEYQVPEPLIKEHIGGFYIEFFQNVGKDDRKDDGKDVGKRLSKIHNDIVEIIRNNPSVTLPEIAGNTGKNLRTIERYIAVLKKMKILERVGGRKEGHWEVK